MTAAKKIKLVAPKENTEKNKGSTDQLAEYFYRISNHEEFFRVGIDFFNAVKKGIKNFAFTSAGYKSSQQKTILGLCCFFDQNAKYKIAIVSDNLSQGEFSELLEMSSANIYSLDNGEDSIKYKSFHHHFDIFDYTEFSNFYSSHLHTNNFEIEIKKNFESYDIIFWDIPEMEAMKQQSHFHYRISYLYESLTAIVSKGNTGKEIESIKHYFNNYNINLNCVLFDTARSQEKARRKKILGLF